MNHQISPSGREDLRMVSPLSLVGCRAQPPFSGAPSWGVANGATKREWGQSGNLFPSPNPRHPIGIPLIVITRRIRARGAAIIGILLSFLQGALHADITTGLQAHYPFTQGTGSDASGNGYQAALQNVIPAADLHGTIDNAAFFNGSNSSAEVANTFAMTDQQTITAWINPKATPTRSPIVEKAVPGYGLEIDFELDLENDGKLVWLVITDDGLARICLSAATVPLNQWTHVAGVIDKAQNQIRLYVNGVLDSSASMGGRNVRNGNRPLRIGYKVGNQAVRYFTGTLDEVRVYSRALSDADLVKLSERFFITGSISGASADKEVWITATAGASSFITSRIGNGPYSFPLLVASTYAVAAYEDTNSDGALGFDEPFGEYPTPVLLDSSKTGIDIQIFPADSDGDGLPDVWERRYGLSLGINDSLSDNDGDSLSNLVEFRAGTSPIITDTDADGLPDGMELLQHGSSPTTADTDGDGMNDAWEAANSLNPLINDSLEDRDLDGLTNKEEYDLRAQGYKANALNSKAGQPMDDGLSDYRRSKGEGWVRRSYDKKDRLLSTEWDTGVAQLYDYDGNSQKVRDSLRSKLDSDSDGLPDVWELRYGLAADGAFAGSGGNVATGDPDHDGFSNLQEFRQGTDPVVADPNLPTADYRAIIASVASVADASTQWSLVAGQLDGFGDDEILVAAHTQSLASSSITRLTNLSGKWEIKAYPVGYSGVNSMLLKPVNASGELALLVGLQQASGLGIVKQYSFAGSSLVEGATVFSSTTGPAEVQDLTLGSAILFGSPSGGTDSAIYKSSWDRGVWSAPVLAGSASAGLASATTIQNGVVRWLNHTKIEYSALNPLPPNAVNRPGTNKWYFISPSDVSWEQAESYALQWGGHLAGIPDEQTSSWISSNFGAGFWIGLRWSRSPTVYEWATGIPFSYTAPRQQPSDSDVPAGAKYGFTYSLGNWDATSYNGTLGGRYFKGLVEVDRIIAPVEYAAGDASSLIDLDTSLSWRKLRPASSNPDSLIVCYIADGNANSTADGGDIFVLKEFTPAPTQPVLRSSASVPLSAPSATNYALEVITVNSMPRLFVGEPDGTVSIWNAPDATSPLVRQLFTAEFKGKSWHRMEVLHDSSGAEGLVGLFIDPAQPNQGQVVYWSKEAIESVLSGKVTVMNTTPKARILATPANGGSRSTVAVRIWDAEAHSSSVVVQYQGPGETVWNAATILTADGGSASSLLSSQPGGLNHSLLWNAGANLGATFNGIVLLRARATDASAGEWSEPMPYTINSAADLDTDGDGSTDLAEQRFGTSPTDANSRPAVQLTRHPNGSLTFLWPTAAGHTYRIEASTTLQTWIPIQTGMTTNTVTLPAPSFELKYFYRVVAE